MQITALPKHICIVSDCFVPQENSAAGMIFNLARSFSDDGYKVTCIFGGDSPINEKNKRLLNIYNLNGINIIYSKFLIDFRNKTNVHRFLYEVILSATLAFKCLFYPKSFKFDLVVWYGPSAFLWFPVYVLKIRHKVPVYYILRDIFPDWLWAINVIKSKFLFNFLNFLSLPQYVVPNIIGLETKKNMNYLKKKIGNKKKLEVLKNWNSLNNSNHTLELNQNTKNFKSFILKSNKNETLDIVYTGNMSVAHDINSAIDFFKNYSAIKHIPTWLSINIFGKGSSEVLASISRPKNNLKIEYWKTVPDHNLPYIYKLVRFGLITLNNNLVNENIPGKFVSYTQFGLAIICFANTNSAISKLIKKYNCGVVIDMNKNFEINIDNLNNFFREYNKNKNFFRNNSQKLFHENFNIEITKMKLIRSFKQFNY
jgi:colanic acid biosynthesis glycosyl transferase WcaI